MKIVGQCPRRANNVGVGTEGSRSNRGEGRGWVRPRQASCQRPVGGGQAGTRPLHQVVIGSRALSSRFVCNFLWNKKSNQNDTHPSFMETTRGGGYPTPRPLPSSGFQLWRSPAPGRRGASGGADSGARAWTSHGHGGGAEGMGYGMGDDLRGGFMLVVLTSQKCRLQISGILR